MPAVFIGRRARVEQTGVPGDTMVRICTAGATECKGFRRDPGEGVKPWQTVTLATVSPATSYYVLGFWLVDAHRRQSTVFLLLERAVPWNEETNSPSRDG